jgi:hypothetical protein
MLRVTVKSSCLNYHKVKKYRGRGVLWTSCLIIQPSLTLVSTRISGSYYVRIPQTLLPAKIIHNFLWPLPWLKILMLSPLSPLVRSRFYFVKTHSDISTQFFAHGIFVALKMEAVSTCETCGCFNETTRFYIQEGGHPIDDLLKLWLVTAKF